MALEAPPSALLQGRRKGALASCAVLTVQTFLVIEPAHWVLALLGLLHVAAEAGASQYNFTAINVRVRSIGGALAGVPLVPEFLVPATMALFAAQLGIWAIAVHL